MVFVFLFFLVFPRKKLVFLPQTIFFLGKSWFSCPKPIFFLGKKWFSCPKPFFFLRKKLVFPRPKTIFFLGKTKKTIFLVSDRIVSQKMFFVFFGFPWEKVGFPSQNHFFFQGKKLVFHAKTTFFLRNLGISLQDQAFSKQRVCFSCVVCARYELVLSI